MYKKTRNIKEKDFKKFTFMIEDHSVMFIENAVGGFKVYIDDFRFGNFLHKSNFEGLDELKASVSKDLENCSFEDSDLLETKKAWDAFVWSGTLKRQLDMFLKNKGPIYKGNDIWEVWVPDKIIN